MPLPKVAGHGVVWGMTRCFAIMAKALQGRAGFLVLEPLNPVQVMTVRDQPLSDIGLLAVGCLAVGYNADINDSAYDI